VTPYRTTCRRGSSRTAAAGFEYVAERHLGGRTTGCSRPHSGPAARDDPRRGESQTTRSLSLPGCERARSSRLERENGIVTLSRPSSGSAAVAGATRRGSALGPAVPRGHDEAGSR
jgi:hypothetical protein